MPALFTSTSIPPNRSTAPAISASTCAGSATSQDRNTASPPAEAISATVPSPAAMSATTTRAPSAARARAVAAPMPPAAPVTTATFPLRLCVCMGPQRMVPRDPAAGR